MQILQVVETFLLQQTDALWTTCCKFPFLLNVHNKNVDYRFVTFASVYVRRQKLNLICDRKAT
jgi:hypothetical protein